MKSITDNCKIDANGIYLPKEFIEDWYDKLDERYLKFSLKNPQNLVAQGRFIGGMDVLGDLLKVINEINE